ncbi:hypothetical protein [Sphingomonas sp.]|uniref:hypothetical protein n=1 Tax=Sphingomonas sp. TaxID=28214 RepID=UPI0035BBB3C6
MSINLLIILAFQALTPALPSAEALALGRKLAEQSIIIATLPIQADDELAELAAEPEAKMLTADQRNALIATGRRIAVRTREQALEGMAMTYAKGLPMSDLRTLVAAAERPETIRMRALEPRATAMASLFLGIVPLKVQAAAEYCAQTRLMCTRSNAH